VPAFTCLTANLNAPSSDPPWTKPTGPAVTQNCAPAFGWLVGSVRLPPVIAAGLAVEQAAGPSDGQRELVRLER